MALRGEYMKMGDARLVEEYRNTKAAVYFSELVRRHSSWMHAYATAITGDDEVAKDVVQDAWMAFMAAVNSERYIYKDPPENYLKGIVYNLAVKAWKKEHRTEHNEDTLYSHPDDAPDEETLLIGMETNERRLRAFRRLSVREQRVLVMVMQGLHFEVIARRIHEAGASTVRSIYKRAVEKLRLYATALLFPFISVYLN